MDEPAFGRASATRRYQRPLHTSALFASLRRSARLLRASSGASAPVCKRPRVEQQELQQPSLPLLPPQPSAFMTQQSRPRPPPDHLLSSLPPPTCASLPLASQLPTFSMEHGESPVECGLLQLTGATQRLPRGHSGGAGSDCLPAAAWPRLAGAAAAPPATAHQPQPRSAGCGSGNKERSCTSSSSIATEKVFAGPRVLSGVRARLGQEVASLREQGLGGSYRGVMQEMALQTLLRGELEYVVPDDAHPRRKPQAADTQLEYAFEALGRAVLAPARLPSRARVLGLADDVMASIGLSVNEFSGAVDWPCL